MVNCLHRHGNKRRVNREQLEAKKGAHKKIEQSKNMDEKGNNVGPVSSVLQLN